MRPSFRTGSPIMAVMLALASCTEQDSPPTAGSVPDFAHAMTTSYAVQALAIPSTMFEGEARGINDAGVIAGWVHANDRYAAVRWTSPGSMIELGDLPGLPSDIANDINLSGTIVGFSFGSAVSFARAFVWTRSAGMRALPDLGGNASIAQAINGSGTVVGWAADSFGVTHAAKWDPAGNLTDLNPPGGTSIALDINDEGDIVGWTFPPGARKEHAHLWRHDGVEVDLGTLGGPGSQAFGVNNHLDAVGVADQRSPEPEMAFHWTAGIGMKSNGFGPHSEAFAISDAGRSVGLAIENGVTGLTRIEKIVEVLPDLAPAKGHFSGPVNLNRCGTIVGSAVTPAPASAALVPVVWTASHCD